MTIDVLRMVVGAILILFLWWFVQTLLGARGLKEHLIMAVSWVFAIVITSAFIFAWAFAVGAI